MDVTELKRQAAEAAAKLAQVEADSKRVEAELLAHAVALGKEASRLLAEKGSNLSPGDADRLLRLLVLRMILSRDDFVNTVAKNLAPIRELVLGAGTKEESSPPQVQLEP
jgi:gamma-glutamyl phosphate reductase